MDIAGSVDVLAFGFDTQDSLPPELAQHLEPAPRARHSPDSRRALRVEGFPRHVPSRIAETRISALSRRPPRRSTLWHLLVDGSPESGLVTERAARATHVVGGRPRSRLDRATRATHRAGHIRVAHAGASEVGERPTRRRAPVGRVSHRVRLPRAGNDARRRTRPRRHFSRRPRGRTLRGAARRRDARCARDGATRVEGSDTSDRRARSTRAFSTSARSTPPSARSPPRGSSRRHCSNVRGPAPTPRLPRSPPCLFGLSKRRADSTVSTASDVRTTHRAGDQSPVARRSLSPTGDQRLLGLMTCDQSNDRSRR